NRPPGAVLLENRAVADSANMEEQPVRKLSDQLALAEPDDRLMKANVCIRVLAHLAGDLVRGEGVDQSVKARDLIVAGLLRCQPRRHALECRPDRDHLQNLGLRLADDVDATAGDDANESLLLELRKGL